MKIALLSILIVILSIGLASGVTIESVDTTVLTPGADGTITVIIENIFNEDIEDVSLQLRYENLPFSSIGSSDQSADEINEDDDEKFIFQVRMAPDARPGDYEIPYLLTYKISGSDELKTRQGTLGVRIAGSPELIFSISTENSIENKPGKISFKIVNKGFADARFVSVKVTSPDFLLLSEEEVCLGTVDSDDFETAEFDVVFDRNPAQFKAVIEYKDFDNNDKTESVNLPLTIYSQKQALELGIIKKNNAVLIIGIVILLIIGIIIWRMVKKRMRLRKSMKTA